MDGGMRKERLMSKPERLPPGETAPVPDNGTTRLIPFEGQEEAGIEIGEASEMVMFKVTLRVSRDLIITALIREYGSTEAILAPCRTRTDRVITIERVSVYIPMSAFFDREARSFPQTGLGFRRETLIEHFPELVEILPQSGPITLMVDLPRF